MASGGSTRNMQQPSGFYVVTKACETHVTVEIRELFNSKPTGDGAETRRRHHYFLRFWRMLQAYVKSLHIEQRLGVPVYYLLPEEYDGMYD